MGNKIIMLLMKLIDCLVVGAVPPLLQLHLLLPHLLQVTHGTTHSPLNHL